MGISLGQVVGLHGSSWQIMKISGTNQWRQLAKQEAELGEGTTTYYLDLFGTPGPTWYIYHFKHGESLETAKQCTTANETLWDIADFLHTDPDRLDKSWPKRRQIHGCSKVPRFQELGIHMKQHLSTCLTDKICLAPRWGQPNLSWVLS